MSLIAIIYNALLFSVLLLIFMLFGSYIAYYIKKNKFATVKQSRSNIPTPPEKDRVKTLHQQSLAISRASHANKIITEQKKLQRSQRHAELSKSRYQIINSEFATKEKPVNQNKREVFFASQTLKNYTI